MKITAALGAVAVLGWAPLSPPTRRYDHGHAQQRECDPVKPMSLKACNKQADAKSLTGAQRSTFVKNCRGPKAPPA